MFSAVAFKTVRRNSRVPNVELFSGSLVRSRTRLGELEEPTHGGLVMARLAGERMRAGLADRTVDRTERRRALIRDAMTPEPGPASVGVTTSPSHPPTGARHHPVGVMCISTSPLTVASEA